MTLAPTTFGQKARAVFRVVSHFWHVLELLMFRCRMRICRAPAGHFSQYAGKNQHPVDRRAIARRGAAATVPLEATPQALLYWGKRSVEENTGTTD